MKVPFSALLAACLLFALPSAHAGETGLIEHMGSLQYFAHKASLSIGHRNHALATFYAHEMEEVIEDLQKAAPHHGHDIGLLAKTLLVPAFTAFEHALKSADWTRSSQRFEDVVTACNQCHQKTGHAYVRIRRTDSNPFLQSFQPAP